MTTLEERKRTCSIRRVNINLYIKMRIVKRNTGCNSTIMKNNIVRTPVLIYVFEMSFLYIYMRCMLFFLIRLCDIFLVLLVRSMIEDYLFTDLFKFLLYVKSKQFRRNHSINALSLSRKCKYIR